jgi:hypothetical protein
MCPRYSPALANTLGANQSPSVLRWEVLARYCLALSRMSGLLPGTVTASTLASETLIMGRYWSRSWPRM